MNFRIVIADDHRIVREGLRTLLEQEPDMQVVWEANDRRQTCKEAIDLPPGLISEGWSVNGLAQSLLII
jgi:DNA-binding NarL/FixJ family response regulator